MEADSSSSVLYLYAKWRIGYQQAFTIPVGLEPEVLPLQSSSKWIWDGPSSFYPLFSI
jgi:hypothetical protein